MSKKLRLWIQGSFHLSRMSLEFRSRSFAFSRAKTSVLRIFFIGEWTSFCLIQAGSVLPCCAIFNAVAQTANSNGFVRTSLRTNP